MATKPRRPRAPDILNSEPALTIPVVIAVGLGLLKDTTGVVIPERTITDVILPAALIVSGWLTRRYAYSRKTAEALQREVPPGYIKDPNWVEPD